MRIVFWENIVSQHKLPYWQQLAALALVSEFVLVVQEPLSNNLAAQGWIIEDRSLKNINLIIAPTEPMIATLLNNKQASSFHVFSGIRAFPMVYQAFKMSLNFNVHRILLTESVNFYGLRSITRRIASFWIERKYLKHYDLVLGSGATTKKWYLECGLPKPLFYPFMYAVESLPNNKIKVKTSAFKLLFIGQLIKRKGLDILIKVLSNLKQYQWSLDVYGTGEEEASLKNMVKSLALEERITFKGVVNNTELKGSLSGFNCLVLPSRFDGWGAVVNEAIASGIKVVCSNRCGASILIVNSKIGHVYNMSRPYELQQILDSLINKTSGIDKDYILKYHTYLNGKAVAEYFILILKFHYEKSILRPIPPWEQFLLDVRESKSIN